MCRLVIYGEKKNKLMSKYRVTAQVTIMVEKIIEADCRDEANMEFAKELEAEYGWADYDTVEIERYEE